jgi:hypothetical protein
MDLTTSLGAMRNGYIATSVLGALEVDQEGNLANWASKRQGKWWPWHRRRHGPLLRRAPHHRRAATHRQARQQQGQEAHQPPAAPARAASRSSSPTTPSSTSPLPASSCAKPGPASPVENIRAITEADFTVSPNFGPLVDLTDGPTRPRASHRPVNTGFRFSRNAVTASL